MLGNDAAKAEYATAKIAVWWDMNDCPIPEGYDARRVRLQQQTLYHLFLAYSVSRDYSSLLVTSKEWPWKRLLEDNTQSDTIQYNCSETAAMFHCKSCSFNGQSLENFRKHLSSKKHALEEVINPGYAELDPVTRMWAKNYPAKVEYATAKIAVWWDMKDCPIPEGYDARRVRPSMEAAFKNLGYSGPVSITAYGDQKQTPDHLLRGLSSTGVAVAHTIPEVMCKRLFSDLMEWRTHNPPPATMMLISDHVEDVYADALAELQQLSKYNIFLAYSFRPYKMSVLVTSAEWLLESLLAVSETRKNLLRKCSERGESTGMFYCKLCYCDCKSLDSFREHLSSKEHALEEGSITALIRENEYEQKLRIERELFPKRKRLRKAFRTGLGGLHKHLRLTNR